MFVSDSWCTLWEKFIYTKGGIGMMKICNIYTCSPFFSAWMDPVTSRISWKFAGSSFGGLKTSSKLSKCTWRHPDPETSICFNHDSCSVTSYPISIVKLLFCRTKNYQFEKSVIITKWPLVHILTSLALRL